MFRLLLCLILLLPQIAHAQTPDETQEQKVESQILDRIAQIPEVRSLQSSVEKQTRARHGVKMWVTNTPSSENNYFTIHAGPYNPYRLETTFIFYYFPADKSFRIEDVLEGEMIFLEEYRKRQKHRQ